MKTLSRTVLTLFVLSFSCLAAIAGEVSFKITRQYLNFPIIAPMQGSRQVTLGSTKHRFVMTRVQLA